MHKCPHCASFNTVKIIYSENAARTGLKGDRYYIKGKEETVTLVTGKRILRGPKMYCRDCRNTSGIAAVLETEEGYKDLKDMTSSVKFHRFWWFGLDFYQADITEEKDGALVRIRETGIPEKVFKVSRQFWDDFRDSLYYRACIHECRKYYRELECLDGERWFVSVDMEGETVFRIQGENVYPPYFEELVNLFKKAEDKYEEDDGNGKKQVYPK